MTSRLSPWWTVLAGAVGTCFGAGIFAVYLLGVFSKEMLADLGLDRSVLSFGLTVFLAATGFGSVSLGVLINRFGIRLPATLMVLVTGLGVASLAIAPPIPAVIYAIFGVIGFAGAAATALPYAVSVAGTMDRNRGLALGLLVAGGGAGGTLGPHFAAWALGTFGWRPALLLTGLLMLLPILGLVFLVRTPPGAVRDLGRTAPRESLWDLFLGQKPFWLIAAAIVGISIATYGVLATLVPMLTDRGLSVTQAAAILSAAGLSSWIGRVVVGWILDRVWAPLVTSVICLGVMVGVGLILYGGVNTTVLIVGAALNGLAMGAEADILAYLISRYFKIGAFSRVLGALWVAWAWGGGVGTAAAGLAFRTTQSYDVSMQIFCAVMLVTAVIVLFLGPYREKPAEKAA